MDIEVVLDPLSLTMETIPPFVGDPISGEPYLTVYKCPDCQASFEIICVGFGGQFCAACASNGHHVLMETTHELLEYDNG